VDATIGEMPAAEGSLRLQVPSLRRLLQSLSITAPATRDADALGALEASARFAVGEGAAALTQLELKLDSTQVAGDVKLPTLAPLSLRFDLSADQVDMDRYLPPEDEPGTPLQLPLAQLKALDAQGVLRIRRAQLAGAAAREMRIDVE
jgi:AsmA protein